MEELTKVGMEKFDTLPCDPPDMESTPCVPLGELASSLTPDEQTSSSNCGAV
jgi:hypothetical protein